jgi:5-methylthioadenosine/S-adenosylhomocysteine deaminase
MRLARYAAPWLLPIEGPPVADGAVLVDARGRIAAAGPAALVPTPSDAHVERLDDAVLLPGLVNTHTHLELTGLEGEAQDADFAEWIRHLIALKADRTASEVRWAARRGIREGWATGVTTVADTGDSGTVIEALAELGGSGIAYHEVFGPHPARVEEAFRGWVGRLEELGRFAGGRVTLGGSPHAPYSVSGPLYARVARHAEEERLPLAVHLAESSEESALLAGTGGPFAEAWKRRDIPVPSGPGCTPVAWLDQHDVLGPRTLCIHVVQASDPDLDTLARRGVAVAHCPRSNRRHGHGHAPLAAMRQRGIRVGVGTDSVASVSPLDLFAEARAAGELAGLSAGEMLALVTLDAACALGLEEEIGSLVPGKWADLIALDLPPRVDAAHLQDTVLTRPRTACRLTLLGGREVHRRGVAF